MSSDVLPALPAPASYQFTSRYRTQTSMAVSGKIIGRQYGGHYYECKLVYPELRRDQLAPIIAFLERQEGRYGIFRVTVPADMAGVTGDVPGNFANVVGDAQNKLYRLTGTPGDLALKPDPPEGRSFTTTGVEMRCSLKNDAQQIVLGRTGLIRLELDLVERV